MNTNTVFAKFKFSTMSVATGLTLSEAETITATYFHAALVNIFLLGIFGSVSLDFTPRINLFCPTLSRNLHHSLLWDNVHV